MMGGLECDGFAILPHLLSERECARLASLVTPLPESAGTRCLLSQSWCADLARRLQTLPALAEFLGSDSVAVQCTYFETSSGQNWLVPLHQDLSMPVAERVEASELRGWSLKEGRLFVQPPAALLEQLLAVRIHLDPCGPDDGALRVVAGSHREGILSNAQSLAARERHGETACCAATGDALLLRPLLLHASSKSTGTSRRRVLHFVFGPRSLPYGLAWQAGA